MRLGTWNEGSTGRLLALKGASTVAPLSSLPGVGAGTPKSGAVPRPPGPSPSSECRNPSRRPGPLPVAGGGSLSAIREHPKAKRPASGGGNGASLLGCRLELALPQCRAGGARTRRRVGAVPPRLPSCRLPAARGCSGRAHRATTLGVFEHASGPMGPLAGCHPRCDARYVCSLLCVLLVPCYFDSNRMAHPAGHRTLRT